MDGLLLIDKPKGPSSFRVVSIIRSVISASISQKIKVGHSGTLDPAASGLLLLAVGTYTKRLQEFIKQDKSYDASLRLGQISDSGDSEGVISYVSKRRPNKLAILKALDKYSGPLMQTPPRFSAIKINGRRAYQLARQGHPVVLSPRPITVFSLKLVSYEYPYVRFKAVVSSGTYIRSLVEDIGRGLGTGAYMSDLRRTKIGNFELDQAISLTKLSYARLQASLITLED